MVSYSLRDVGSFPFSCRVDPADHAVRMRGVILSQMYLKHRLELAFLKFTKVRSQCVGTKGVSQYHLLSFDDNKVLKIINWIC